MTCAHVIDWIDAGPFAVVPQERVDAARAHARQCPTCGPALALSTALTSELRDLPDAAEPADLAGIVMARIAQAPEAESATAAVTLPTTARVRTASWASPLTALGGLVACVALILTMPSGGEAIGAFLTPRFSTAPALATMPASAPAAMAIGAGLLLYVAGLFGPVRQET